MKMSYIDKNLMQDEVIIFRTKLHWIIYRWIIIWLIVGFALLIYAIPRSQAEIMTVGLLFFVIAFIAFLMAIIDKKSSEFGITNKRVLMKTGFIRRKSIEILLPKVEGIMIDQSIGGRIFGYGTIVITGTGGLSNSFKKISKPLEFKKKIQEETFHG